MDARDRLERAAAEVIVIMKGIPELADASVAVIGGLALWKYIRNGRTTQDVDFIINIDSAPQSVKSKLLALPDSPFVQQAQLFLYKDSQGHYIQIDITPAWQSPYLPAAAKKLRTIPAGSVPYISPIDLLIFKMNSCGLRAQVAKRSVDANDAEMLIAAMGTPLNLTAQQQELVEPRIADVVSFGSKTEEWWRQNLGLPAKGPSADDYWTWSEEYQNWYHLNDDGTYEWASQGDSSSAGPSQKPKKSSKSSGKGKRR